MKKHQSKPDKCFVVWYKDSAGKGHWQTIGWASSGITSQYAKKQRDLLLRTLDEGRDPHKEKSFTIGNAVEAYTFWAEAEGKFIKKELDRYRRHLMKPLDAMPVSSITPQILTTYKAQLLKKLSEQSVLHCFSFVRRCINYAISNNMWSGINPLATTRTSTFRMPKPDNKALRFYTKDEAKGILAALKITTPQTHDMSLISLRTGMRFTEIISIRRQDIHPHNGMIYFNAKGGRPEHVYASADIIDLLLQYNRNNGELIFQSSKSGAMKWGVSSEFKRTLDALEINAGITSTKQKATFHTWRHTFASWLAQSGKVTLQELKELMRHDKIETTLRYAHLIPGHQQQTVGIVEDLLK